MQTELIYSDVSIRLFPEVLTCLLADIDITAALMIDNSSFSYLPLVLVTKANSVGCTHTISKMLCGVPVAVSLASL